ncbi:hypothetical protein ABPG74_017045 [Tetrahymena malaccensis]
MSKMGKYSADEKKQDEFEIKNEKAMIQINKKMENIQNIKNNHQRNKKKKETKLERVKKKYEISDTGIHGQESKEEKHDSIGRNRNGCQKIKCESPPHKHKSLPESSVSILPDYKSIDKYEASKKVEPYKSGVSPIDTYQIRKNETLSFIPSSLFDINTKDVNEEDRNKGVNTKVDPGAKQFVTRPSETKHDTTAHILQKLAVEINITNIEVNRNKKQDDLNKVDLPQSSQTYIQRKKRN